MEAGTAGKRKNHRKYCDDFPIRQMCTGICRSECGLAEQGEGFFSRGALENFRSTALFVLHQ